MPEYSNSLSFDGVMIAFMILVSAVIVFFGLRERNQRGMRVKFEAAEKRRQEQADRERAKQKKRNATVGGRIKNSIADTVTQSGLVMESDDNAYNNSLFRIIIWPKYHNSSRILPVASVLVDCSQPRGMEIFFAGDVDMLNSYPRLAYSSSDDMAVGLLIGQIINWLSEAKS